MALNDENEICNGCGKPTTSLGGRKRICYDCETDGLPVRQDGEDGFEMREPTKKEKKQLDLGIIDLDIDWDKLDPSGKI